MSFKIAYPPLTYVLSRLMFDMFLLTSKVGIAAMRKTARLVPARKTPKPMRKAGVPLKPAIALVCTCNRLCLCVRDLHNLTSLYKQSLPSGEAL